MIQEILEPTTDKDAIREIIYTVLILVWRFIEKRRLIKKLTNTTNEPQEKETNDKL